ncbi:MAG: RluA family pseudouridine synthase, partial [Rhodospirillales bacterium]|nr:RluA family pseudouridine synthase [Rhodospirillales bacterium]
RAKAGDRLQSGQQVRVPPIDESSPKRSERKPVIKAEDAGMLRDRVLYRDEHLIVLDKPAGLAVQGGTRTDRHLDAMLEALCFGGERPRLVHRLDKDTSGVLVLARTAAAAAALAKGFRSHAAHKRYWAVVVGIPKVAEGRIDLPLAKHPGQRGERIQVDADEGRRAVTDYRVVERAGGRAAWLELEPLTGRTHQLRVHCAAMDTPILGDGKYGGAAAFPGRQWTGTRLHLHARALAIPHPAGGLFEIEAPLPEDMRATWRFFGFSEREGDLCRQPNTCG